MIKFRIGGNLMVAWIVFYFAFNTFFGWNNAPQSFYEALCNIISFILFVAGFGMYLYPLLRLYEDAVEKYYANKPPKEG